MDADDIEPERVADTTAHTGEGPLWHPDEEQLYWVDIPAGRLYRYDPATGRNETAYATDDVWSARWNGNRVVRYDPEGHPLDAISLPARKVSSVAFGGPAYEDLYPTTALRDGDRATEGDGAGALFRVPDVGVRGRPEFRSRIATE